MSLRWMFASAAFALTSAAGAAVLAQPAPPPAPPAPAPGSHTEVITSITDNNGERTVTIERDGQKTVHVEHVDRMARDAARQAHEEVRRVMIMRDPAQRRAHEADHLRAILQLRPNQEPALQAYLSAMQPPKREAMEHAMPQMQPGAEHHETTPERLAQMQKMLDEHTAEARAHLDAIRRFYDQLDPAQKRAYDELPPMEHGMMGGPMMIRVNMPHMEMHMHGMPPMPPMPVPPVPPVPPPAPGF